MLARNDYYEYVNGEWCRKTAIPGDQFRWGTFNILAEENRELQRKLCEKDSGLVGQLYRVALKQPTRISSKLLELFCRINENVVDVKTYLSTVGMLCTYGVSSLFHICKLPDDKNPSLNVPQIFQSGLGLPDMSYYSERTDLHEPYKQFLYKLCQLYGQTVDVSAIFEFETANAKLHLTCTECRDPVKTYNRIEASEIHGLLPEYFNELHLPKDMQYYVVQNPELLTKLRSLLSTTSVKTLREYLIVRVALQFANYGPDDIVNERFQFYGNLLNGQKERQPRWKEALGVVRTYLCDELGKLYTDTYYSEESSTKCKSMISDLVVALEDALKESDWMTNETRLQALDKLRRFDVKVGSPDEMKSIKGLWKDLNLLDTDMVTLSLEWAKWYWRTQECAKFYTPVNRKLWEMGAFEVNAYYHPSMNEIIFPAGILQLPFFGFDTYEENIGAIGVIIGHEMTHGYDDSGSQYNQFGELKEWWNTEDRKEFEKRSKIIEEHYSSLTFMGKPVNGALTLGENIADIGGVKLALRALKKHYVDKTAEEMSVIYDRFFRAFATIWRNNISEGCAHQFLATDPHSPQYWRVNAVLCHIPEFLETYGVVEGDAMYLAPEKRMNIW